MTNPFEAWGIDHLSASSLNSYLSEPALWLLRYIHKFDSKSPAMFRGTAIEKALVDALRDNAGVESAVGVAEFLFDAECERANFPLGQPEVVKERELLRPMVESGYVGLIPLAEKGMEFQKRIELDLGVGVPLIGYIDILGSKVYELKTTTRMPSDISTVKRAHLRQAAGYAVHEGKDAEVAYITPPVKSGAHQGFKTFKVPTPELYVAEMKRAALSLKRILEAAIIDELPNRESLQEMIVPDFDRFYWDDESKAEAVKVWAA